MEQSKIIDTLETYQCLEGKNSLIKNYIPRNINPAYLHIKTLDAFV